MWLIRLPDIGNQTVRSKPVAATVGVNPGASTSPDKLIKFDVEHIPDVPLFSRLFSRASQAPRS